MAADDDKIIDLEPIPMKPGRQGDGGTYLVVADDSPEFEKALRYAAHSAQHRRGHVGILHVIEVEDFQHWGSVEARMKAEMRDQAEQYIWSAARKVNELNGMRPSLYITEGKRNDALIQLIDQDLEIVKLVLGAGESTNPLVAYFTGKGIARLRCPLLVVPGHLDMEAIDNLA